MTLLNEFAGNYQFNELCSVTVRAAPGKIYRIIKELTASDFPFPQAAFSLPLLPKRILDKTAGLFTTSSRSLFKQALESGFVLLAESPNQEIMLGWIGRFWKIRGPSHLKIHDENEFVTFNAAGYAKAAINFRVERGREDFSSRLSTETRVWTNDDEARRSFASYWRLIHPGSTLARCLWLRAIKAKAETNN